MNDLPISMPRCEQCKTYHPPLQPGEKCPLSNKGKIQVNKETALDIHKFISMIKTILESQLPRKKDLDYEQFLKDLTINITQFCENYKGKN